MLPPEPNGYGCNHDARKGADISLQEAVEGGGAERKWGEGEGVVVVV